MIQEFKVDLTKIEGKGEFLCPKCGENISPDDESDMIYKILEIEKDSDNTVKDVVIRCKCGSIIHLVGFYLLKEVDLTYESSNWENCLIL